MLTICANAYLLCGHDVFSAQTLQSDTWVWKKLISIKDGVIQLSGGVSEAKMWLRQCQV